MEDINNILKGLKGKEAWRIKLGHGSMLTIDFGNEITDKKSDHIHGEWNFWTYSCVWRIDKGGCIEIGSEDSIDKINEYLSKTGKMILVDIFIDLKNFYSELSFDNGVILKAFPVISEGEKHWLLFTPCRKVLVAGPGNVFSWEPYE